MVIILKGGGKINYFVRVDISWWNIILIYSNLMFFVEKIGVV